MKTLRRFGILAATLALGSTLAFANSIIYGFDPVTGLNTVTQLGPAITGLAGNVDSPASLFSFLSFNDLGLAPNYIYNNQDTTFDYQFSNVLTSFSITNADTNTDNVTAFVQAQVTNDSLTTLSSFPSYSSFLKTVDAALVIPNASGTFSNNVAVGTLLHTIATISSVTLESGGQATFTPLPQTYTDGISFNVGGTCTFGDTSATDGCAANLTDNGNYFLSHDFSFGTTDDLNFSGHVNGTGNFSVNFTSIDQYSSQAEVTYEYSVFTGTPEPTTMFLMGTGLLGLGFLGKKRLKRQ